MGSFSQVLGKTHELSNSGLQALQERNRHCWSTASVGGFTYWEFTVALAQGFDLKSAVSPMASTQCLCLHRQAGWCKTKFL